MVDDMVTFLIGFLALVVIVVVIWTLYELIDFVSDLVVGVGAHGCLVLLIMLVIVGLLVYGLGLLIAPLLASMALK